MKIILIILTTFFIFGCYTSYQQPFSKHGSAPEWEMAERAFNESCDISYKENKNWQTPQETKKLKSGDCKAHAVLLYYLLNKECISNRIVVGKIHLTNISYHAWNEIWIDGRLYIADSTNGYLRQRQYVPKNKYIETLVDWNVRDKLKKLSEN